MLCLRMKVKYIFQVLSMVGDYMKRPISLFSVVMTTKKHALYKKVFEKIKQLFPEFVPKHFMSDFEWSSKKALKIVFARSRVWGCR